MKSLQLLTGMSVLALGISGCSTWDAMWGTNTSRDTTAAGGTSFWSGRENPNTGKYMPSYPTPAPAAKTGSAGYPSTASNGSSPSNASTGSYSSTAPASSQSRQSTQSGYSSSQDVKPQQGG